MHMCRVNHMATGRMLHLLLAQPSHAMLWRVPTSLRMCSSSPAMRSGGEYAMRTFTRAVKAEEEEEGAVAMLDASELPDAMVDRLVPSVTQVANWAYRGKHEGGDERAWTGERHLIDGIRTNDDSVRKMVVRAKERGPTAEALLLAAQGAEEASSIIGTVQVTRGEGETSDEAEIGFFAVDPDLQVGRERGCYTSP